jgi:hypothetical protein
MSPSRTESGTEKECGTAHPFREGKRCVLDVGHTGMHSTSKPGAMFGKWAGTLVMKKERP